MKLIQFNGCKTFAILIILIVLLIYYHNFFKSLDNFYQRLNENETECESEAKTETTAVSPPDTASEGITTSKRIKRFLIFQGGGVVKLVFGTSFPIMMADKKRSLNYFYNFQMQYVPPTIPLYGWSIYNTTTFAARTNLRKRSMDLSMRFDKSQSLIYEFIETLIERSGNTGHECLLRIICELARAPLIENVSTSEDGNENQIVDDYGRNIYHKVVNAIFTPLHPNVDERYLNARVTGQNGANCDETFGRCPIVEKLLKRFTQFV